MLGPFVFAALLAVAVQASRVPAGKETLEGIFRERLETALRQRDAAALRTLLPFLTSAEEMQLLRGRGPAQVESSLLGPIGQGRLMFLSVERADENAPQRLWQVLCELRVGQQGLQSSVAARRVPLAEAARAFRIHTHSSRLRVEAGSGATEMVDSIEFIVVQPTRWIFFLLDAEREVSSVVLEAGAAEVSKSANFVALERRTPWAPGDRIRVAVRSRLRLAPKKAA